MSDENGPGNARDSVGCMDRGNAMNDMSNIKDLTSSTTSGFGSDDKGYLGNASDEHLVPSCPIQTIINQFQKFARLKQKQNCHDMGDDHENHSHTGNRNVSYHYHVDTNDMRNLKPQNFASAANSKERFHSFLQEKSSSSSGQNITINSYLANGNTDKYVTESLRNSHHVQILSKMFEEQVHGKTGSFHSELAKKLTIEQPPSQPEPPARKYEPRDEYKSSKQAPIPRRTSGEYYVAPKVTVSNVSKPPVKGLSTSFSEKCSQSSGSTQNVTSSPRPTSNVTSSPRPTFPSFKDELLYKLKNLKHDPNSPKTFIERNEPAKVGSGCTETEQINHIQPQKPQFRTTTICLKASASANSSMSNFPCITSESVVGETIVHHIRDPCINSARSSLDSVKKWENVRSLSSSAIPPYRSASGSYLLTSLKKPNNVPIPPPNPPPYRTSLTPAASTASVWGFGTPRLNRTNMENRNHGQSGLVKSDTTPIQSSGLIKSNTTPIQSSNFRKSETKPIQSSNVSIPRTIPIKSETRPTQSSSDTLPKTAPLPPPPLFICLNPQACMSLRSILDCFKAPISEEQGWALIYQFASLYHRLSMLDRQHIFTCLEIPQTIDNINIHRDGSVHCSWSTMELRQRKQEQDRFDSQHQNIDHFTLLFASHRRILRRLAVIVYKALDYNLPPDEQCQISAAMEDLFNYMTADDDDELIRSSYNGIESKEFEYVMESCKNHLKPKPTAPEKYYKAVCRALVTETMELRTFLQQVLGKDHITDEFRAGAPESVKELSKLGFNDWARFWVQVIDEMRQGFRLKRIEKAQVHSEYTLTPYEILMEDIRSKNYCLKKVMVNGETPARVRNDAHSIIMEYIKSRPLLKKASDRVLAPPKKRELSPREQLMESIRQGTKLRHVEMPAPKVLKDRLYPIPEHPNQEQQAHVTIKTTISGRRASASLNENVEKDTRTNLAIG